VRFSTDEAVEVVESAATGRSSVKAERPRIPRRAIRRVALVHDIDNHGQDEHVGHRPPAFTHTLTPIGRIRQSRPEVGPLALARVAQPRANRKKAGDCRLQNEAERQELRAQVSGNSRIPFR
jgi:hypothetical protein